MLHHLLQDSRFYALLHHIDHDLAVRIRRAGCRCGGPLHRSNYPRKPRGPSFLNEDPTWEWRYSLCCARCRKRTTPPSVRYAGRRIYAATVVVLSCLDRGKRVGSEMLNELRDAVGVTRRTVGRWLSWWRSQFVQTPLWTLERARFMPPAAESQLPESLLERFGDGTDPSALNALLHFISPLSTKSYREP